MYRASLFVLIAAHLPSLASAQPDLVVTDITLAGPLIAGVPNTATARLRNAGTAATGIFDISWFLDGQEFRGGHDPLAASETSTGNIRLAWTPTSNTVQLRFDADPGQFVSPELDERNNSYQVLYSNGVRQSLADVAVVDVNWSAPPRLGQEVRVQALVRNVGTVGTDVFNVKWFQNGQPVGFGSHSPLAAGETSSDNVYFFWTPQAPGTYTFRFEADVDQFEVESNEGNNWFERSVIVASGTLPDLEVDDLDFDPLPRVGVQTVVTARLKNAGGADTPQFNIKWFLEDAPVGYGLHLELGAGQISMDNVRFFWTPTAPGPYRLRYEADVDLQVGESNEDNNIFEESVVVAGNTARVDLRLSHASLTVNDDGWYNENPVTAEVTLRCPANGSTCSDPFSIDAESRNGARMFFYGHDPGPTGDVFCLDVNPIGPIGSEFSHQGFFASCNTPLGVEFALRPGESRIMRFFFWVQPSAAASFVLSARWGSTTDTAILNVPAAQVRPVVFIHGILGSMPPQNLLIADQELSRRILDPFLWGYRPILDNLQKMGYQWNETLFALAYDWRKSNRESAAFLAQKLQIVTRGRQRQADLVVHSMGGLVARSHIQSAAYGGTVRKVVFIATPHKGFPFDYRTREEGTWDDYLYNAPLSGLQQYTMRQIIWPRLVAKKFEPTEDELRAECYPDDGSAPPEYQYPVLGPLSVWNCSRETILNWSRHPTRGALSLQEMLPYQDGPAYLLNASGLPLSLAYPFRREPNDFLVELNANKDRLLGNIGSANVYFIYGDGAAETDRAYDVGVPSARGQYGTVQSIHETSAGDDLIPSSSTYPQDLFGSVPLENAARIDASPPRDARPGRHKEIVLNRDVLTYHVPRFLTGARAPIPLDTYYPNVEVQIDPVIRVTPSCPINVMVIDPLGRRLGFDPTDGSVKDEIPRSVYTQPGIEPQLVTVGDPLVGDYRIVVTGFGDGPYEISIDRAGQSGVVPLQRLLGRTVLGQVESFDLTVPQNLPPAAVSDTYDVLAGVLTVDAPGVLANDVELDSEPLTAILVGGPTNGTLDFDADGSFRYAAGPAFSGVDRFTYKASDGFSESSVAAVTLRAPAPEVYAGEDRTSDEGSALSFTGYFRDPSGASSHTFAWDFGDGHTASGTLTPAHTYTDDGDYTVILSVTSESGVTGSDALQVSVANVPPLAEAGADQSGVQGQLLHFAGSFSDAGASDTHVFHWEFGDGATASGTLTPTHAFAGVGAHTVTLTVRDDDGGESSDTLSVAIANAAPTVDAGPDVTASPNVPVSFRGSFVDAGVSDTHVVRWDFGDGAEAEGTLTPTHTYVNSGAYTVTLTVTDNWGGVGRDTLTVRVFCEPAFVESFDAYEPGADPTGWVDYRISDGRFRSGRNTQTFRTAASRGDVVYRSVTERGATEYRTPSAARWRDYELTGRYLSREGSDDGHSILVYSDLGNGSFYRLRFEESKEWEGYRAEKGARRLPGGSRARFESESGVWYAFRIRVEGEGKATRLRARFWLLEAAEPSSWLIDVVDASSPLEGGGIAFISEEKGFQVDDLRVEGLSATSGVSGDRDGDSVCDGADNCPSTSNADQKDGDGDGIGDVCDRCTARFDRAEICLDRDYDERTGLSASVVEVDPGTLHVGSGGACGKRGTYRLQQKSGLVLETPELPEAGLYRVQLRVSASRRHDGVDLEVAGRSFHVPAQGPKPESSWWWTEPVTLQLSEGSHRLRIASADAARVDVETLRIEQLCAEEIPRSCSTTPEVFCLDDDFEAKTLLSSMVREVTGGAGHSTSGKNNCGDEGYYYVARNTGRLGVSLDVPASGRYGLRFRYRVGTRGQKQESLRVVAAGKRFDFLDGDLANSNRWEESPSMELDLEAGSHWVELQSIGKDGVHLEALTLEPRCPVVDRTPPTIVASVEPKANAFGWHRDEVTVSFTCTDAGSGVATCPPAVRVTTEGADQIVSGTAYDAAGNSASVDVRVSLDRTPPQLAVSSPRDGETVGSSPVEVRGAVSDALSGLAGLDCQGSAVTPDSTGNFSCDVALVSGRNDLVVVSRDRADNAARVSLVVHRSGELEWPNADSRANSDPWLAEHHAAIVRMRPRLMVLNFVNHRTMDEMTAQVEEAIAAIAEGSRYHGYENPSAPVFLEYELAYAVDLRDPSPPSGYPYRNSTLFPRENPTEGYWGFDYERLFSSDYTSLYRIADPADPSRLLGLDELIDRGLVHEVWIYGDADVPDVNAAEILELKPVYDEDRVRIPFAMNRCAGNGCFDDEDDIPSNRTVRIAFFNNTRGVGCLVHSLSHGMESIGVWNPTILPYLSRHFTPFSSHDLDARYGVPAQSWYACPGGDCLSYPSASSVRYDLPAGSGTIDPYDPVCGNVHFPPNARGHYDDQSPVTVLSSCQSFRDGTGALTPFTTSSFEPFNPIAPDCQGGFLLWWRQNMPGLDNAALDDAGMPMLNWWPFLFY